MKRVIAAVIVVTALTGIGFGAGFGTNALLGDDSGTSQPRIVRPSPTPEPQITCNKDILCGLAQFPGPRDPSTKRMMRACGLDPDSKTAMSSIMVICRRQS